MPPAPPHTQGQATTPIAASEWGSSTIAQRTRWLKDCRKALIAQADQLGALAEQEVGKPRHEWWTAEILPLVGALHWHQRNLHRLLKPRPLTRAPLWLGLIRGKLHRAPLGRVGIIATWNYPIQLLGIQAAQALAAGNTLLVKPSERCPKTQLALLDIMQQSLPANTMQRYDHSREAGARLVEQEPLDHLIFTGSTAVGAQIARTLADRLIPSTLELSGRDTALILDDADDKLLALAAKTIWAGLTMNAGQTCMAPRRILAPDSLADRLLDHFSALAAESPPLTLIDADAARTCRELANQPTPEDPRTCKPAIIESPPDHPLVEGSHFGPVAALVRYNTLDDAIAIHSRCNQHLATSIYTASPRRAHALAPKLRAAVITINDTIVPTAHPALAITGTHHSGWGPSRGSQGLLSLTRPITITRTPRRLRVPAGEPPKAQLDKLIALIRWRYG